MFKELKRIEYSNWKKVDENLSYNENNYIHDLNSIIFNNILYLFWRERNGTVEQLRYRYYDGVKWNNDNDSLNYDAGKHAESPNSIIYNNKLYVFWHERNEFVHQLRYKYYDGYKWSNDVDSLNYDKSKSAQYPNSIIYNNKLYVFWIEPNGSIYQLRYKHYDGEKWHNDNGSLNYKNSAAYPNSIIYNNNLYVFWYEWNGTNDQIRYKYYNGERWNDDLGNLNYNVNKSAKYPNSIIYNNKLYVFWNEYNDKNFLQVRYKYCDGSKWYSDNGSLNYDTGRPIYYTSNSKIYNNKLYIFWYEYNGNDYQIRYKYYDENKWNSDDNGLNYNNSKGAYTSNSVIYNNKLYVFWYKWNGTNDQLIFSQLNFKNYLISDNNFIYQMNPLSKLKGITQSNLTSETFMEYGSNKLTLNENEYNELSEDAEVLVYNSSQEELKLHKNITYDKRFIMTLDKPKIRIKPNNPDSKPKLMLNAHRLMEYKYDVKINTLEKPIKEVIEIKYDIDDEAVIRKDTFKTSENPYVATITVEQENGDIVKNSGNLTLYNREPKLLITMTGMLMRLEIGDDDKNKIKYRMLLNGKQIYPLDGDWSNYFDTPYSIARKFKSNEISVGRNNVIQVFVKDEYEKQSSLTYNFIGEYSGLLFCDELGGYYSDDLGNIVKRLNFGNILAGKTSEVKTVYLKNACGYNIKDVVIKVTENLIPSGSDILIDSEKDNFIGSHEIKIDKLPNEEVIPFYIRVKTDIEQEQGGRFEITVNSTSSKI
ncbi:hypothetical protein [Clostridium sp. Marseille-QA1073]